MIEELISDLPEIYQPIHGHPSLSAVVSRSCLDRLEHIAQIHDALQHLLGRPLKVLDLGCAQGYFSLNLAERGAIVHGIDYLDKNIAVCKALAQENPILKISFETGRVEEAIGNLVPGQYDLVLGLSVFHHIVHEHGASAVKAMLELAAAQSGALLVELALREEPLYWAPAQPEDPRTLLDTIAFVHEIARHGTHLAPIRRPLFVASNLYWILGTQAAQFDSWSFDPHALAHGVHQGTRRYFINSESILKQYRLDPPGEYNRADFLKEIGFLKKPAPAFAAPSLIAHGEQGTEAWVAMQRLPGRLLLDLLQEGASIDSLNIIVGVLSQLTALEASGLYHNDVRSWNVLVAEDGTTHLIDYGSISSSARDCTWPGNPFLSFFIFVQEVATGSVDSPIPMRAVAISPFSLPQPYRGWATSLWHRPLAEWSFKLMLQTLQELRADELNDTLEQPINAWMKAIEEAIQVQKQFCSDQSRQFEAKSHQAESKVQHAESKVQHAETKVQHAETKAQHAETKAQHAETKAQQAETRAQLAETRAQHAETKVLLAETKEKHAATKAEHTETVAKEAATAAQKAEATAQLAEAKALRAEVATKHAQAMRLEAEIASQRMLDHLHTVLASTSWRVTFPLRWVGIQLKLLKQHGFIDRLKALVKKIARCLAAIYAGPENASISVSTQAATEPPLTPAHEPEHLTQPVGEEDSAAEHVAQLKMSPDARQIYVRLKTALQKNQGSN